MKRVLLVIYCVSCACFGTGNDVDSKARMTGQESVSKFLPPNSTPIVPDQWRCSIEFDGNSVIGGADIVERPAAALKRLRPAYVVDDRSVGGSLASGALPAFIGALHPSRFIVLSWGRNDFPIGSHKYDQALRSMIARVRVLGRSSILTGMAKSAPQFPDTLASMDMEIARSTNTPLANWQTVSFDGVVDLADGLVHPGPAYSLRLVQRLIETLDALAPECKL